MNNICKIMLSGILALFITACDDTLGNNGNNTCNVNLEINIPENSDGINPGNVTVTFLNISSGKTTMTSSVQGTSLTKGLYDITYEATATLPSGITGNLRAKKTSVELTSQNTVVAMNAFFTVATDDLIISEVFFAGTLQSSGNQYNGDDYVKLYNNTDHVIYADGLTLFESKFTTTQKYNYTPDIMDSAVTVQALYTIPGNGTEHPVKPGEYLLLADTGIDHRVANPNSFDLSHADFEWFDVSTKPSHLDIDSPYVPNLDKWYCYTLSFWVLHNRGFKAYGIARIPVDKETYLKDYLYSYDYEIISAAGTFPMSQSAYRLPNEWIVDVVNCSVQAEFQWTVTSPLLDMGWTSCGTIDKDKTRYFRSVRRKMLYVNEDGNPVLKDTNNSAADFNTMCIPSEIELQGTPIDLNHNLATTVTYDGVTPIKQP